MSVAYAFGVVHNEPCRALYDWNDIEASSCTCGAYDYGVETGECYWHDIPLSDEGLCSICQGEWDAWINRRKPVGREA